MDGGDRRAGAGAAGWVPGRGWTLAALAALVVAAAWLASPAWALREIDYGFQGKTGDGYRYQFAAFGLGPRESGVGLAIITKAHHHGRGPRSSTWYTPVSTRSDVSRKRIHSGFGQRGSVGLRFRVKHSRTERFGNCGKIVLRRGIVRGHLRFRGEAGYTRLLTHRAKARQTVFVFRRHCARTTAQTRTVILAACRRNGMVFGARSRPDLRPDFVGITPLRRHRGVFAGGAVYTTGAPETFTFTDDLSSAAVDPPLPFKGSGSFATGGLTGELRFRTAASKRIRVAPAPATLTHSRSLDCGPAAGSSAAVHAAARLLRLTGFTSRPLGRG